MRTNVSLGAHFEQFIAELLDQGRYQSVSEILCEGLRLVEIRETRLKGLRAALSNGESSGFADFSFEDLKRSLGKGSDNQM